MPRPLASRLIAARLVSAFALGAALALTLAPGVAAQSSGPPPGFEPAFTDGRVNPHRASRSALGDEMTDRVWTRDVPRRVLPRAGALVPVAGGTVSRGVGGPPPGYEYAFGDGRLNPERGGRSAAGAARMGQVWTDDVPRRVRPGADWGH
ncbi:hypothetical protein DLJ49_10830 [Rhodovulum sp. 12E13]|uniref:hypothetical protein n=1 Tax=Rhodovulum sp. 12E13 TaxID=2203891 RepID=UPI000E13BC15|nr:hypothetical protein [Rhodovulum sp. 12E13]RDC72398.1 hypothetical protein DLJ49_10830 [Rhodovulum sp. 12E13]